MSKIDGLPRRFGAAAVVMSFGLGAAFGLGTAFGLTAKAGLNSTDRAVARSGSEHSDQRQLVSGVRSSKATSNRLGPTRDWSATPQPPVAPTTQRDLAEPAVRSREQVARTAFRSTVFIQAGSEYGAGLVLSNDGHIVTCRHVIQNAREIWLVLPDGTRHRARVVEQDSQLDLALLVAAAPLPPMLRPAELGSITGVAVAQEVYAVGAPHKMTFSLNRGIVSYVARPFDGTFYLQTDIPTNGGNSGGPILNERGQVIAISAFILRGTQGLAFGLPIDYVVQRFRGYLSPGASSSAAPDFRPWLAQWAKVEATSR